MGKPASALSDLLPDALRYRGNEVFQCLSLSGSLSLVFAVLDAEFGLIFREWDRNR